MTTFSIQDALRRSRDQGFLIPQFQRDFVWNTGKLKQLIDSIARGYPIGSLLLLARSSEFPLAARGIDAVIRDEVNTEVLQSDTTSTDSFYVLDGQQRLTSLVRILMGADPKRAYYFDLKRMINEFEGDSVSWVVSSNRGKLPPSERRKGGRQIRSDLALDPVKSEIFVTEYLEDGPDFPELREDRTKRLTVAAKIKSVFETIRNYKLPAVVLDAETGLESICRVFETINSSGTRLSTFDLAVARYFPDPDLKSLWENSLIEHPVLAELEADPVRVLQILVMYEAKREDRKVEPTRSRLLQAPAGMVRSNWHNAVAALAAAYQYARELGARRGTVASPQTLVSLAAAFLAFPNFNANDPVVKRWYFCNSLQQGARAANYQIARGFDDLSNLASNGKELPFQAVRLDSDTLQSLRPADVRYKTIMNIVAMTARLDLWTGSKLEDPLEDHHLFPKRMKNSHGLKRIDGVANRVFILANSNRSLSDREPSDYLSEIIERGEMSGTQGEVKRRFAENLLPYDPTGHLYLPDSFDEFCQVRSDLILERVKELIGPALNPVELTEN